MGLFPFFPSVLTFVPFVVFWGFGPGQWKCFVLFLSLFGYCCFEVEPCYVVQAGLEITLCVVRLASNS